MDLAHLLEADSVHHNKQVWIIDKQSKFDKPPSHDSLEKWQYLQKLLLHTRIVTLQEKLSLLSESDTLRRKPVKQPVSLPHKLEIIGLIREHQIALIAKVRNGNSCQTLP